MYRLLRLFFKSQSALTPLLLLSEKGHARAACSLASALTTALARYQPFSGESRRGGCFSRQSIADRCGGSSRAATFFQKSERAHAAAPPFRKRSRSRRLFACKRAHDGFGSLPTFFGRNAPRGMLFVSKHRRPLRRQFAGSDFFIKKSLLTHSVAAPFRIEPASLGFDSVFFLKRKMSIILLRLFSKVRARSRRCSSFPKKVTLAPPVRLQARSRRLWLAANLFRAKTRRGVFSYQYITVRRQRKGGGTHHSFRRLFFWVSAAALTRW